MGSLFFAKGGQGALEKTVRNRYAKAIRNS